MRSFQNVSYYLLITTLLGCGSESLTTDTSGPRIWPDQENSEVGTIMLTNQSIAKIDNLNTSASVPAGSVHIATTEPARARTVILTLNGTVPAADVQAVTVTTERVPCAIGTLIDAQQRRWYFDLSTCKNETGGNGLDLYFATQLKTGLYRYAQFMVATNSDVVVVNRRGITLSTQNNSWPLRLTELWVDRGSFTVETDPQFSQERIVRPGLQRTIALFNTAALGESIDWYGASLYITSDGLIDGNMSNTRAYHSSKGSIFAQPIDVLSPAPQAVSNELGVVQNPAQPGTMTVLADVANGTYGSIQVCLRGLYASGVTSGKPVLLPDVCGPQLSIQP
jgi:hypothetical protein